MEEFFGGEEGATTFGAQLTLVPLDTLDVALYYANAYTPSGFLGTGIGDDQLSTVGTPLKTHAYGVTVAWQATQNLRLGGWGGYTYSTIPGRSGDVETTNWMVFANLEDMAVPGDLAGLYLGQPPRIVDSNLPVGFNSPDLNAGGAGGEGEQPGTTLHFEAFYRYPVSDNIAITPGVITIFNPGHAPESDTIFIGALRATFSFLRGFCEGCDGEDNNRSRASVRYDCKVLGCYMGIYPPNPPWQGRQRESIFSPLSKRGKGGSRIPYRCSSSRSRCRSQNRTERVAGWEMLSPRESCAAARQTKGRAWNLLPGHPVKRGVFGALPDAWNNTSVRCI